MRAAAPARRIISTLPHTTELIVALGASERLVARTDYDLDPRLAHLPSLGRNLQPSTEAILALKPDLVVVGKSLQGTYFVEQLEAMKLPFYVADVERIDDIYSTTERLGVLLGLPEESDALVAWLRGGLAAARIRYASDTRPSLLYVVWHDPPLTAGPDTFIDEVISAAGGRNVFADLDQRWPTVSVEEIVARTPDYIVVPRGEGHSVQPEWLAQAPGWRNVRAVREHRLIVVDSDLFNRPGTRLVEAVSVLGEGLRDRPARPRP